MAGETVLVIDDSPTITKVVQLVLTKADGVKQPALERKVAEANALARAHPAAHPDVVLTSSETGQGIAELRAAIAMVAG